MNHLAWTRRSFAPSRCGPAFLYPPPAQGPFSPASMIRQDTESIAALLNVVAGALLISRHRRVRRTAVVLMVLLGVALCGAVLFHAFA